MPSQCTLTFYASAAYTWGVMSDRMVAYCGLVCTDCYAYVAKRTDDDDLRAKAAKAWSTPDRPFSPEDINCDGCKSETGERFKYCAVCGVRACASERGVETCAHCDDFGCGALETVLKMVGEEVRESLNEIRASLV